MLDRRQCASRDDRPPRATRGAARLGARAAVPTGDRRGTFILLERVNLLLLLLLLLLLRLLRRLLLPILRLLRLRLVPLVLLLLLLLLFILLL